MCLSRVIHSNNVFLQAKITMAIGYVYKKKIGAKQMFVNRSM